MAVTPEGLDPLSVLSNRSSLFLHDGSSGQSSLTRMTRHPEVIPLLLQDILPRQELLIIFYTYLSFLPQDPPQTSHPLEEHLFIIPSNL